MPTLHAYLETLFDEGAGHLPRALTLWRAGVELERSFWTQWFETKGLSWREEYAWRLQSRPLADWQAALLPDGPARVLDVGSGPASSIGHYVPGRDVEVIAVDPLADIYAEIIATAGVTVPLPARFAFGEDISARFEADSFDLIQCTNALDHSIEPLWCLVEMLILARVGAKVVLMHRLDEAEGEAYAGFHQWNFNADAQGHFIIWNRTHRLDASAILAPFASVVCTVEGGSMTVIITKQAPVPMDLGEYHRRMRAALLRAALRI